MPLHLEPLQAVRRRPAAFHRRHRPVRHRPPVVAAEHIGPALAEQVAFGPLQQRRGGVVGVDDGVVLVQHEHHVGHRLEERVAGHRPGIEQAVAHGGPADEERAEREPRQRRVVGEIRRHRGRRLPGLVQDVAGQRHQAADQHEQALDAAASLPVAHEQRRGDQHVAVGEREVHREQRAIQADELFAPHDLGEEETVRVVRVDEREEQHRPGVGERPAPELRALADVEQREDQPARGDGGDGGELQREPEPGVAGVELFAEVAPDPPHHRRFERREVREAGVAAVAPRIGAEQGRHEAGGGEQGEVHRRSNRSQFSVTGCSAVSRPPPSPAPRGDCYAVPMFAPRRRAGEGR